MLRNTTINIADKFGKGYKEYLECTKRYRVVKGGRESKKSTNTAIDIVYKMMKFYHSYHVYPNTLVIRKFGSSHRDSTFAQLKWAMNYLGVSHLWKAVTAPLELRYLPSGQKIIFKGIDDPDTITSVTVEKGSLCWVWWEEAYQIKSEEIFNKVDMSIRGEVEYPLYKQHSIVLNPWSENTWIKARFFDVKDDDDVLAITRNYDCNEFLDAQDLKIFDKMKVKHPKRFLIEGLGEWGISEGLVFEDFKEKAFDYDYMRHEIDYYGVKKYKQCYGMDFGFSTSPTAFIALLVDPKNFIIYVYDEFYKTGMKNKEIKSILTNKGYQYERIIGDCASAQQIGELQDLGINVTGCHKTTIVQSIQRIQDYKIVVHPRCQNTIVELNNYCWDKDKISGKSTDKPIDDYNHLMDALRYATENINKENFSW